jgi:lipid A 3-O-deacylase
MAWYKFALLGTISLAAIAPAGAQSLYDPHPLANIVDELRFGIHAHAVHNAMLPFLVNEWDTSRVEDVSFDVLFKSPDIEAFRWIGSPRPEVGATISLGGRDSIAHAGLTWQLPIFDTPVYLEGTFGAAIHNGYLTGAPVGRANFGCRVNFYERFGVGMNIGDNATATLTYEHTSNNAWCEQNDGLSNFGLRVGWKF